MKVLVYLLLFVSVFANCQEAYHTLEIEATLVNKIPKPLGAAIDRHIEVSKVNETDENFFVLISVFPGIDQFEIPKDVFDSIYAINDFKTVSSDYSFASNYIISIVLANKLYYTVGWNELNYRNYYYFKYKNYDVLINTELELIFETQNIKELIRLKLINQKIPAEKSLYTVQTRYSMWNNKYLTEIRYKDLISPDWTECRDEFQ